MWATASAKRDKLNELLTELNATGADTSGGMEALDAAANAQDKLDLEFADGLKAIATFVDGGGKAAEAADAAARPPLGGAAAKEATDRVMRLLEGASSSEEWDRAKCDATMREAIRLLSAGLPPEPDPKKPVAGALDATHPLCYLREFVEEAREGEDRSGAEGGAGAAGAGDADAERAVRHMNALVAQAFSSSAELYRALLLRATAQTFLDSWDTITTYTSGDIDRAAVAKTPIPPQRPTLKAQDIHRVFAAYAHDASTDWVQAWWTLIDADGDGLIDEQEVTQCVDLATAPVHTAMRDMVRMALQVCPLRPEALGSRDGQEANDWFLGGDHVADLEGGAANPAAAAVATGKLSWRERRRELKARKAFAKGFDVALDRHFRDQLETPHRLRCIYAWADKAHQSNKRDSILVDASEEWGAASSLVGRKRFVELEPKLSHAEFRTEQARHFPHLDHVGEELAMSFKEDLWVRQGKVGQNRTLRRDCALFLLSVTAVDVAIMML